MLRGETVGMPGLRAPLRLLLPFMVLCLTACDVRSGSTGQPVPIGGPAAATAAREDRTPLRPSGEPHGFEVGSHPIELRLAEAPPSPDAALAVRLNSEVRAPTTGFVVRWRAEASAGWSDPLRLEAPLDVVLRFSAPVPRELRLEREKPNTSEPVLTLQAWWEVPGAVPRPEVDDQVWDVLTLRRPTAWRGMASEMGGLSFAGGYDLSLTVEPVDWAYLKADLGHGPPFPLEELVAWWLGQINAKAVLRQVPDRVDELPAVRVDYHVAGALRDERHSARLVPLQDRLVVLLLASSGDDPRLWQAGEEILATVNLHGP